MAALLTCPVFISASSTYDCQRDRFEGWFADVPACSVISMPAAIVLPFPKQHHLAPPTKILEFRIIKVKVDDDASSIISMV